MSEQPNNQPSVGSQILSTIESTLGIKPGYKTTEFWVTLIVVVGGFVSPRLSQTQAAQADHTLGIVGFVCATVAACAYAAQRLLAKRNNAA
jgi:hypothetical protein